MQKYLGVVYPEGYLAYIYVKSLKNKADQPSKKIYTQEGWNLNSDLL